MDIWQRLDRVPPSSYIKQPPSEWPDGCPIVSLNQNHNMKSIKVLIITLCAAFAFCGVALAEKEKSCCEKAKAEGKACTHPCCVKAAKDGKTCEKCNGKKEKEDDKKK